MLLLCVVCHYHDQSSHQCLSQAEEQITADYLLKIFRAAIPQMPKTAVKFGSELQAALQPMVIKPSPIGGLSVWSSFVPTLLFDLIDPHQALQETVACMCAVVQHLTHDFSRLVGLLRSCNGQYDLRWLDRTT
jgi:cohesin loading factor subunit SCC2